MKSIFQDRVRTNVPNKSAFDLSNETSFTFAFGQLIPIFWKDVIPSDSFKVRSNVLLRLPPLFAPIMHRIDCFVHYFFVRYNLLWRPNYDLYPGFDEWFTEDEEYTNVGSMKYITINNANKGYFAKSTVADYLGLPHSDSWGTVTQDVDISALPFLAYQKIWDDYYRDQVLQEALGNRAGVSLYSGQYSDLNTHIDHVCEMQYVNYEKDYFTSALTTAYIGTASDVELDLDLSGKVRFTTSVQGALAGGDLQIVGGGSQVEDAASTNAYYYESTDAGKAVLEITELRRAEALMRYYEFSGRVGRRYTEHILGMFGVFTDDSKHNFPKYLGGGRVPVQISEVVSQAETLVPSSDAVSTPLGGPLAGHAMAAGSTNSFQYSFDEHGIVMGLLFVRPRTAYKEGIDRYWRKFDREDFYNPYLQHIGDQAILQSEIFYDDTGTDKDDVFGYQQRWSEYKMGKNTVAGEMNYTESMDHWTLTQFYGSAPSLNEDFIMVSPARDEFSRIFTVSGLDQIYANVYNQVFAIRPMDRQDIGGNVQH